MRMNKKILILILTSIFCGGCATFKKIDYLPPGAPKGYVEFQQNDYDRVGKATSIFEVLPDTQYGYDMVCDFFTNDIIRIAAAPGIHTYSESGNHFEINVVEGMVTYVIINLTKTGVSTAHTVIQHNGWGYTWHDVFSHTSILSTRTVSIEEADRRIERIKKARTKQERKEALDEIL